MYTLDYIDLVGLAGDSTVSLESASDEKSRLIYVVLTDTGTLVSKVSKWITKDPYNHVSLSFDSDLSRLYTYALVNGNSWRGGLKVEDPELLKGARYSMWAVSVAAEMFEQLVARVSEMISESSKTRYNHLGLINAIFKTNIFDNDDVSAMICSQFVVKLLESIGVTLVHGRAASSVRPYELVKSKLLKHVRRGKFK